MKFLQPVTIVLLHCILHFNTVHAVKCESKAQKCTSGIRTGEYPADTAAIALLRKVSDRLNGTERISYDYQSVADYPGSGYHSETQSYAYYEFLSSEKRIGMRFQIKGEDQIIYNTAELFTLYGKNKTIKMELQPDRMLTYITVFYNSLPSMRKALPLIIADQTIPKTARDTTINNNTFCLLQFNLHHRTISHQGQLDSVQMDITRYYTMIIDKMNDLPTQITESFTHNNSISTVITRFTNINLQPDTPGEQSWYSSAYLDDYTPENLNSTITLIAEGQIAPDWLLPKYGSKDSVSLRQYKGKLVLLDFWFCFCGPCIESVPGLNKLGKKYRGKKFKLLSINNHDTPEQIKLFIRNNGPEAEILHQGIGVTKQYGILEFPSMVLIGKDGKVIYSGGYDYDKLDALIGKGL